MIETFPAESRFHAENDWLNSYFSFSFGPYYDLNNTEFGPMRVLNDDIVAPQRGFGAHPHSDMEVVSIVLTGKLRHADNLGNVGVTSWGEIQRMSAGTGIIHTEFSASEDEDLNLLQMWFMPEQRGLLPSYEITSFDVEGLKNQLVPVVSATPSNQVAKIHQDMTIYLSDVTASKALSFSTTSTRRVFFFVIDGDVQVNGEALSRRDSLRMTDTEQLEITAKTDARIMLIDLP